MDFTELVRKMRNAQKDYFRYRRKATLIEAKLLEKQVDDLLASNFKMLVQPVDPDRSEYARGNNWPHS